MTITEAIEMLEAVKEHAGDLPVYMISADGEYYSYEAPTLVCPVHMPGEDGEMLDGYVCAFMPAEVEADMHAEENPQ